MTVGTPLPTRRRLAFLPASASSAAQPGQRRVDGRAGGESAYAHLPTLRNFFEIWACFIVPILGGAGDAVFSFCSPKNRGEWSADRRWHGTPCPWPVSRWGRSPLRR